MSTPRTITVHGIECEVPDCEWFQQEPFPRAHWLMRSGRGPERVTVSQGHPWFCGVAAALWRMETEKRAKQLNGFLEAGRQAMLWQRAFEKARESK